MHPILFKIGSLPVHTYGFLIAVGFMISTQILKRLAILEKMNVERVLDLAFYSLLLGMLGGRILFVITRWESFVQDPIAIFKIWEGGLVFLGGLILVVLFLVYYLSKNRIPVWKFFDIAAPTLVMTHAFGRLGCFAAGCCYGKPTDSIFGVRFNSDLIDPYLRGVPLHPTQLYESFSLFILFFVLIFFNYRKKFDGQVSLIYFLFYPIIRIIIEIFRGDPIRGFVIDNWVSTSQFISGIIFVIALVALVYRLKQLESTNKLGPKGYVKKNNRVKKK